MNSVHIEQFSSIYQATEMKGQYLYLVVFRIQNRFPNNDWNEIFSLLSLFLGSSSIVVLAYIVIAVVSAIDEDDSFEGICLDEVDGTLIENVEDCSSYFKCGKEKAEKMLCVDDTLFDTVKRLCQPPDSVTNCADEKPTHTNDLCPALGKGTFRIPYPDTSEANAFYILCEDRKNMGSRRTVRNGNETVLDQPYFRDCPKTGRSKVLDIERPTLYFLCDSGIHLETGLITADIANEVIHPSSRPKKAAIKKQINGKEELKKWAEEKKDKENSEMTKTANRTNVFEGKTRA